ncbi:GMP synthase glutamine-hydrolyzing [Hondaea fermentalgiana]|uniref:GMP synthase [glutamine-hydrolyzing] n=1 Tax=Hondaea fermentalgiana TaxID=2315210 RepID=A0A2R5GB45_9STRA|nr:GMP synthase glutamine-hydrolyzing [Hondaea fermentalgiana]|eukprot:GBG25773.1 GMP synthase glutamine-hydrolyzing [Hondaea fermentalgiana]
MDADKAGATREEESARVSEAVKQARALAGQLTSDRKQIAILDFGSHCLVDVEVLKSAHVIGVVLSGGPASVYDEGSPHVADGFWDWVESEKIPVLGVCYGLQEMVNHYGGKVEASAKREYGKSIVHRTGGHGEKRGDLFFEIPDEDDVVWMSHGDKVTELPPGFKSIAHTDNCPETAIAGPEDGVPLYGIQFHPEVTHTKHGATLIKNFAVDICGAPTDWDMKDIAEEFIREVREKAGPDGHVIGAVSGGVDSSVGAVLLHRAIGDRFHAILVDNGCLRLNEAERVLDRLRNREGIDLHLVDASDRFLAALKGVEDPEVKRKTIGALFIDVFQEEAERIKKEVPEGHTVDFLLQGTLYPDVIESISYKGPSATIKSHHNVGGLPEKMSLKLIEPLRELFKDEVRSLGLALGLEHESVFRHPFPGPGLAIRILGEVNKESCDKLRLADDIAISEIRKAGIYDDIAQAFVVLLPVKSVGVMGDGRTYENVVALRCVNSSDFMTANWYFMDHETLARISNRIINEVPGINRVCYDISSKPPATIEWL